MIYLLWNRGNYRPPSTVVVTDQGIPYTHTKFHEAITALSIRLDDPDYIYWTQDEMGRRIIQAMRMFQALTSFYIERAAFTIDMGDAIVDLHQVLTTRFDFRVTDQDTIRQIQYSLLEPPTGNTWAGTDQFSYPALVNALQRRRNQFLFDTAIVLKRDLIDIPSQPVGRVPLPDSVITINRVAWVDLNNVFTPVFRDDEFSAQSFNPGWPQEPGVPQIYSAAVTPPVSLQLIPPPLDKGRLEILAVNTGPDLNPAAGTGVPLAVPDDLAWAVEFGALADLLSLEGLTHDPTRAAYCESMYRMGVEAAKINSSVLNVQIDDVPVFTGSVFELDAFAPDWQSSPAAPTFAALCGRNLLAFSHTPDGAYGVSLDFLPNLPVPTTSESYLQIGKEHLEGILDMAQHLCSFKQGATEFTDSMPLLKNFLALARGQNDKLTASVFYKEAMFPLAHLQEKEVPVLAPPAPPARPEVGNAAV